MELQIGAVARTIEGKDAGKIYKVVIDPHENRVSHLVISTGLLMGRLIVVPAMAIRRANMHHVWLNLNDDEVRQLPDFIQTEYAAPPPGWSPPFNYPPGSVLWPGGYTYAPVIVEQEKSVPPDSLEINHGTEVFALDGKVGVVTGVAVDPEGNRVTGFYVGTSEKTRRNIFVPLEWVSAAGGGRLGLNRTKAEIQAKDAA